jgi:hypothetical protein
MNTSFWQRTYLVGLATAALAGVAAAQGLSPAAAMQHGIAFRRGLVAAIVQKRLSAAAAIAQIQATATAGSAAANRQAAIAAGEPASTITVPSATGLLLSSPDVDFSIAAIDVGHGLLAARRITDAIAVFKAAETKLSGLVTATPDSLAHEKAQYLGSLALIRSCYLNEFVQAKADIDKALLLEPGNKALAALRAILASEHATLYASPTGT